MKNVDIIVMDVILEKHPLEILDVFCVLPERLKRDVINKLSNSDYLTNALKMPVLKLPYYSQMNDYVDMNFLSNITIEKASNIDDTRNISFDMEYSSLIHDIMRFDDKNVRNVLFDLIKKPMYDTETVIENEQAVCDMVGNYTIDGIKQDVNYYCNEIMRYKISKYDKLILMVSNVIGIDDIMLTSSSYGYLSFLDHLVQLMMGCHPSMVANNDIATLCLLYLKELGVCTRNQLIFVGRKFSSNIGNSRYDEVYSIMNEMLFKNVSSVTLISSLSRGLLNKFKIGFQYTKFKTNDGCKSITEEDDHYIITRKMHVYNHEIDITHSLMQLSVNEILQYLDDKWTSDRIMFSLSENDCGQLMTNTTIDLATAYDKHKKDLFFIGTYKDEEYLLFKNKLIANQIYGISLSYHKARCKDSTTNRKILTVPLKRGYYFKHVLEDTEII